jgi:hypothetical protein
MKATRAKAKTAKKSLAAKSHPKHLGIMIAVAPVPHGMPKRDEESGEDRWDVEGGKARKRLDRPARKPYAAGGHVGAPSPSLRQAALGIDANHPAFHSHNPNDASDVLAAKKMLHSSEASQRLSDADIKALGDYIIEHHASKPAKR